eukprot:3429770-Amphidinium_carterae.1
MTLLAPSSVLHTSHSQCKTKMQNTTFNVIAHRPATYDKQLWLVEELHTAYLRIGRVEAAGGLSMASPIRQHQSQ